MNQKETEARLLCVKLNRIDEEIKKAQTKIRALEDESYSLRDEFGKRFSKYKNGDVVHRTDKIKAAVTRVISSVYDFGDEHGRVRCKFYYDLNPITKSGKPSLKRCDIAIDEENIDILQAQFNQDNKK